MRPRVTAIVAAAVIQLVAVVLAHELVFLARFGSRYGEALAHAGHGETWSAAVMTSAGLAVLLAVVGALRLIHLGLLVRRNGAPPPSGDLDTRALFRAWLRIAPRIAVVGVVMLSIQENLERAAIGQGLPGPGLLLTPEYAGGLWITIAVGLAVGLVAALFDWRRRALLARLRAAHRVLPRTTTSAPNRPGVLAHRPSSSILGRRSALRAPPLPSVV